ncbi:AMP-binding protein [Candidatus Omnitrophota bacterium]
MAQNLAEKFKETALKYQQKTAICYRKNNLWQDTSFEELKQNAEKISSFLLGEGVQKGDRVGLILENRPEWPTIFLGTLLIGAALVPLSPEAPEKEVENIIADSGPKIVFTNDESFLFKKSGIKVISVNSDTFKNILKSEPGEIKDVTIAPHDLACLLYTSGTTAKPKGVMLSHRNLLSNCDSLKRMNIVTESDGVLSMLPLHHTYPLTVTLLLPLLYGGQTVYPGSRRGGDITASMTERDTSIFVAVPQVFYTFHEKMTERLQQIRFPLSVFFKLTVELLYLIRRKTGINLSKHLFKKAHEKFGAALRLFVSGGARLDEMVEKDFFKFGFTIVEGYGLTETSPVLTINPLRKPKIGSVGLAIPDVEVKIIDKDKKGIGQVIARGPNIMEGYYKRDDLTKAVLKNGWFYTGDLGYIDRSGYLFLTGRQKDIIVLSSGLNIHPEEIEEAYSKDAPLKEICVFEAPSKSGAKETHVLWATVVPDLDFFKKYGEVNLRNVLKERFANVSKTLPSYKRLMGFSITLEPFPRTLLGKIKRFAVKEIYSSRILKEGGTGAKPREVSDEDKELAETPCGKKVIAFLQKHSKLKRPIVPSDSLELDLTIDSLGRIDLVMGLEKVFSVEISDEVIGQTFTVRDVILGIESLLAEGADALSKEEKRILFDSTYWKRVLEVLPKKPNLDKIDLKPGSVAWLGGFLFTGIVYLFFKVYSRLRVEGKENFPEEGPYILFANHTSYFDGLLVASSLPHFPKLDLFFMGFRPYFNVPVIRNLVKIGRIIPLDFAAHFLEALRSSYYVLKHKKGVCLFPEGLRTLDGKVTDFKRGFGILAKETGAKIVPLAIIGAFEAWPRTSTCPKKYPIKVKFGKPMDIETLEKEGFAMGAKDSYDAICIAARKALVELKGEK